MPSQNSPAAIADRLTLIATAWKANAPAASFGGMTLEEFNAKIQPSFDDRKKIKELEDETVKTTSERDDHDVKSSAAADLVVKGVMGDVKFGEDSPLYEAMGYVRKSERKTGLTRKTSAVKAAAKVVK